MRYCRRFLAGIPHQRAGHPRVTHPSATPFPLRERAFDLHVLGTPPAFILSQDQTRHSLTGHPFSERIHLNDEQSRPNITLGRFAHVLKLTETASTNSCCTVFHSSIVKVQQYVVSNTTTEIGAFSLSFQTGEELLSSAPNRGRSCECLHEYSVECRFGRRSWHFSEG